MASINFNLPNDIAWGDYLLDGRSVKFTVEVTKAPEQKKEVVHIEKEPEVQEPRKIVRRMPWCKRGNSCLWSNCKFRHERCKLWSQRSKGQVCRSLERDPMSNKCPYDGGCLYDHRDEKTLQEFIYTLDFCDHLTLHSAFRTRNLEPVGGENYSTKCMSNEDRALLIRSLKQARDDEILQYGEDDDGDMIKVHFIVD